jgi:hypothetical protein
LAQAYTEIEELSFIIKSCRLKPYLYLEDKEPKTILYKWWVDEFGNSLKITKNKKLHITYNDLAIDREKIVCTDLYSNLEISKIFKISKLAYMSVGIEEDFYQDSYMISLLGMDDYWRSYLFLYDEWVQVSPLLLGTETLKLIFQKKELLHFLQFDKKNNMPMPCLSATQWLTYVPLSDDLLQLLEKEHQPLLSILYKKDIPQNG